MFALRFFAEVVLANSAERANEIVRKIFEFRTGSKVVFFVTGGLIVDPSANVTNVFLYFKYLHMMICDLLRFDGRNTTSEASAADEEGVEGGVGDF